MRKIRRSSFRSTSTSYSVPGPPGLKAGDLRASLPLTVLRTSPGSKPTTCAGEHGRMLAITGNRRSSYRWATSGTVQLRPTYPRSSPGGTTTSWAWRGSETPGRLARPSTISSATRPGGCCRAADGEGKWCWERIVDPLVGRSAGLSRHISKRGRTVSAPILYWISLLAAFVTAPLPPRRLSVRARTCDRSGYATRPLRGPRPSSSPRRR